VELTPDPDPDALTAALLQLSEHASLLRDLDARHRASCAETAERITALTALADAIKNTLADHAAVLDGLAGLDQQVAALAARLDRAYPGPDAGSETGGAGGEAGYRPGGQRRFWQLDGQAREQAVARLRAWVEQVYRPGYGHLAASLGPCWEQHPLCLYTLDWLSELWAVLYLDPCRTPDVLAGQAEWQARLLEAAAAQMTRETTRCPRHRALTAGPRP
jgi:hypothetical protein